MDDEVARRRMKVLTEKLGVEVGNTLDCVKDLSLILVEHGMYDLEDFRNVVVILKGITEKMNQLGAGSVSPDSYQNILDRIDRRIQ